MDVLKQIWGWAPALLKASETTILLTLSSVSFGIVISVFLALAKISKIKILKWISTGYIFFFRGTPLLMQLFFIYFGLPNINPALTIQTPFMAAWIAFSLNSAAYLAEIIRAAIQSIDKGQIEASRSLGMSYAQTMRLIVIPQSIRRLIPPIGNEFIMLIKDTSIVFSISLVDLMKQTTMIMSSTGSATIFIPAMFIYLFITAVLTFVFNRLEKKFSVYE